MSEHSVSPDPVGTVRRHHEMLAVKQPDGMWVVVYPDSAPTLTSQRIEDIADKWPLEYRHGGPVEVSA